MPDIGRILLAVYHDPYMGAAALHQGKYGVIFGYQAFKFQAWKPLIDCGERASKPFRLIHIRPGYGEAWF
jgi:hypothetical protein